VRIRQIKSSSIAHSAIRRVLDRAANSSTATEHRILEIGGNSRLPAKHPEFNPPANFPRQRLSGAAQARKKREVAGRKLIE